MYKKDQRIEVKFTGGQSKSDIASQSGNMLFFENAGDYQRPKMSDLYLARYALI
jgi:hypothetical protein